MFALLGLISIIVFPIQVFKAAKSTERNVALWTLACAAVGIGFQFLLPLAIGVGMGVYYALNGMSEESIRARVQGPANVIGVVGLILSIGGMALIAKQVSKVKDDEPAIQAPPPPPPTFSQDV